jgi:hypothetical protein
MEFRNQDGIPASDGDLMGRLTNRLAQSIGMPQAEFGGSTLD